MIHPTAIIADKAFLGKNVEIGPFVIIHDNVHIGDNSIINSYCEIGISTLLAKEQSLYIGCNATIRSHATIYIGSVIGDNLNTGHYVSIRENSIIGKSIQIASRGDIQGDCSIGDFTKMHADVHIGKLSKIASFVWMFSNALLTNDSTPPSEELRGITIEDFVVLGANALLLPGITIAKDAVVAAGSVVKMSVAEGRLVSGYPAKNICKANILRHHNNIKIKAYPWRYRFHRGYTSCDVDSWMKESKE